MVTSAKGTGLARHTEMTPQEPPPGWPPRGFVSRSYLVPLSDPEIDRLQYLLELLHDQSAGGEVDLPLIEKFRSIRPRE